MSTAAGLTLLAPWIPGGAPLRAAEPMMPEPYVPTPHPAARWRRSHTDPILPGAFAPTPPRAASPAPLPVAELPPQGYRSGAYRPQGGPPTSWWGAWLSGLQTGLGRSARAVRAATSKLHFWATAAALVTLGLLAGWTLPLGARRR